MSYGAFDDLPIVIDNGTGVIKVGLAEQPFPQAEIPNIVGLPKHRRVLLSAAEREKSFGQEAISDRGLLRLSRPMSHGVITNSTDMNDVWEYIYKDVLKFQSKNRQDHPVLLTETPNNPIRNRITMASTFFEQFDVPALFVAPQPVLALYATGRVTGCVLDSGAGVTQCVPIVEGFALPHAMTRMDVAGQDVDRYFEHLLRKLSGVTFHTTAERELVRELKEGHGECLATPMVSGKSTSKSGGASSMLASLGGAGKKKGLGGSGGMMDDEMNSLRVTLPDGKQIQLGSARFRAPELLFDPSLIGLEYRGIHYCVLDAVAKADLELRRSLFQQILLSGGSTMFRGFGQRLLHELKANCGLKSPKFKIFAPVKRHLTTWVGGSVLATLQSFHGMWITRKEWDEVGQSILYRKTFL